MLNFVRLFIQHICKKKEIDIVIIRIYSDEILNITKYLTKGF